MAVVLIVDDSELDRRVAGKLLAPDASLAVEYAEDGFDALEQMAEFPPDIVLTDLQMPKLDGLELVRTVRQRYPLVPVVLMTAHGSEEIAVQALQAGAASYVPKAELPRHLLETIQNVLAVARSRQQRRRLLTCVDDHGLQFVLDTDASLIPPLVDYIQRALTELDLVDDAARVQVAIALEEALFNALYHGNLELSSEDLEEVRSALVAPSGENPIERRRHEAPYCNRKVYVDIGLSREEATFRIRDEGPGFDISRIPDPRDPSNLNRESGRGLLIMEMFMDEVERNEIGNEVRLVKRRDAVLEPV